MGDRCTFVIFDISPAGWGMSEWRICGRLLHPHPEGPLGGSLQIQQVPDQGSGEDGAGGSSFQARRGEL